MGCCSGSLTQIVSGSESDPRNLMDQRKRKRMQSNRESARRSRMRKQQHLDGLMAQIGNLRQNKTQMISRINLTTHLFLNVEAENSVLRAQILELNLRLDSLNQILSNIIINNNNNNNQLQDNFLRNFDDYGFDYGFDHNPLFFNSFFLSQQPIVASADQLIQRV